MASLSADVLVVGAGPAGSSAAARVAQAGFRTILIDRCSFPRDKVCGDALIPDALAAVQELGLEKSVGASARTLTSIRIYAPNGTYVSLAGRSACLPRYRFDEILRANAIDRGAVFMAPVTVRNALIDDRVTGAFVENRVNGERFDIRARVTLLATGAVVEGLNRFAVTERRVPSAIALRAYFQVPAAVAANFDHLCISYDASTAPGYGWIFPGPDDVFNVGVGYFIDSSAVKPTVEPSKLWASFADGFEPAAELLRRSQQISPLKGAPLRTAMKGAQLWRPGLLVAGEAAGLTYSFSGEGIGKAMASGLIAGDLAVEYLAGRLSDEELGPSYVRRLQEFAPRFDAYRIAQDWLGNPRFANFLAGSANRSAFVRRQLEGLFNETTDPRQLFSLTGVLRSFLH